jgi:predicted Rossmann fold flavoprotein
VSGRAEDVLEAFERMLARCGASVVTNARITGIDVRDGAVRGIYLHDVLMQCDAAIIATGGMSYKKVGTTGDGISWTRRLGRTIVPVRAALAPIYFEAPPPEGWQGVALRDIRLRVDAGAANDRIDAEGIPLEWCDDMLLTHRGVSGPAVLEVSRAAALAREYGATPSLVVDLAPDRDFDSLGDEVKALAAQNGRSEIQSYVERFVPRALVSFVLERADVASGRRLAELTKVERTSIAATLKALHVGVVGEVPIDRGEVTAGGIALDEVDPRTMRVRQIDGLYAAGEALDVAGSVGGYNLQAAFSTGWVAGRSAALALRAR